MMKKLLLSMCFMLLLGVSSCREDSLNQETMERDKSSYFASKIESALKFQNFNSYYMKHHLSFDKSDYIIYKSGGVTYYEFPLKAENLKKYELSSFFRFISFSVVAYTDTRGDFKSYLVERCSNEIIMDKFYLTGNFANGTVNIYTLDGAVRNNIAFRNGKYIASKDKTIDVGFVNYNPISSLAASANKDPTCVPTEVSYPLDTYTYIDYYKIYQDALTGQMVTQFMTSVLVSHTTSYVYSTVLSCSVPNPSHYNIYNHEEEYIAPNTNPCAKIKTNLNDTKFKEKINSLNTSTVLNYDHEAGYASTYTSIGSQFQPMVNSINTHNLTLPNGNTYFGFIHTHNNADGVIKIFSPADVATFLTSCLSNAQTSGSLSDAYAMVITSNGSYMLQYTGTSINFGVNLSNWNSEYEKLYQDLIDNDNLTQSTTENAFLQFLQNTVNISGLEVYKVDAVNSSSSKLSLNGSNISLTPCP